MRYAGIVAAVAVALALSACGTAGTGSAPGSSPSPGQTTPIGAGYDVVVTEQNQVATMRVGQTIELILHAKPGMTNWANVMSSDPSLLKPIVNPAASAIRGVTLAAFKAVAPGQTDVTASAGALCSPGQACPMYAILFSIRITITG